MDAPMRIVLVYNADGGALNRIGDALHKLFAPKTYPCSLCMLSYGPLTMRAKWRTYLKDLPQEVSELHRDEFHELYDLPHIPLPAILSAGADGRLEVLLSKPQLDALRNVDELIAAMEAALAAR
ncbi:hypothetical protein [Erythrobacter sp. AP23]|uniref:hypothetical protein n=1 Tax=Erythrobacter sp. AP23 TaxID=499656 RepID=UPI0009FA862C|nr:hypothetical protein [Erythrobacter sp. AP23]